MKNWFVAILISTSTLYSASTRIHQPMIPPTVPVRKVDYVREITERISKIKQLTDQSKVLVGSYTHSINTARPSMPKDSSDSTPTAASVYGRRGSVEFLQNKQSIATKENENKIAVIANQIIALWQESTIKDPDFLKKNLQWKKQLLMIYIRLITKRRKSYSL